MIYLYIVKKIEALMSVYLSFFLACLLLHYINVQVFLSLLLQGTGIITSHTRALKWNKMKFILIILQSALMYID